jgi:cbb3-type cytochrome oxidase maturation protein
MSVMFVLVPVALAVVLVAVVAFVWAARRGQFDDLTTPALRALHDEPAEASLARRARARGTGRDGPGHDRDGGTGPAPEEAP